MHDESAWKVLEFGFWNRAGTLLNECVVAVVVVNRVSWTNEVCVLPGVCLFVCLSVSNFT